MVLDIAKSVSKWLISVSLQPEVSEGINYFAFHCIYQANIDNMTEYYCE